MSYRVPPPIDWGFYGLILVFVGLLGFLGWAAWASIDAPCSAFGQLPITQVPSRCVKELTR